jgi:hypothetical protein
MTNLRVLPEPKQRHEIKVDLDERAFLFPSGKQLVQLHIVAEGRSVRFDGVFAFNQTRTPPTIATLDLDDAWEFGRRLVEAVHSARTQLAVTETARIEINVIANGYRLQFGEMASPTELFLSTACIWRVCHGVLRAVDAISAIQSN